ncbi:unnamed protein product [Schistosoma margrebowiei]|uniref:Uncharacterized protein n=1 Tax=Schistosoma margrebowiei TaxID=48269 RepID=A0A183MX39_9TREM|nr:unnamed protein product [Schistosoma margrebowiei]
MVTLSTPQGTEGDTKLFAQHIRRNVLRVFSDASNSVISQQLGDLWRTVPRSCRNQYDDEANRLVKIHQIEFPNYKYQPKKRQITSSSSSSSTTTTTATTTTANTSRSNNDQMRIVNPNQFHNTTHTLTQPSISMNNIREDQLITSSKLLSTNLLKTSTDYNVVYSSSLASSSSSSSSSTVTNKLPTLSNRNYSIPGISSVAKGQTNNGNHEVMNNFITSPSKLVCNTVYAKLEPKPLSVSIINTTNNSSIPMNNNNNTTNSSQTLSFKPTIHSLSSVLPPLLTLSSNHHHHAHHHHHQTNRLMNEQFSLGICDSAYASGINSSSSSSASSPAVGELISPAKSCSSTFSSLSSSASSLSNVNIKQTKHSPIRRKIHFIPIRPQSQQLPPVGNQPTRQRFLSANNGITTTNTTTNNSNISTIGNGYIQMNGFQFKSNSENVVILPRKLNDLHVEQKEGQLTEEFMNDTLILQDNNDNNGMVTTDILTPVYIQLDHEGQNPPTEGLMLTLPPGTTFIQANHDSINRSIPLNNNNNTISKRFYITNGNRMIPAISKSVQILQPLKVMNVIHHHHHVHPNHSSSSTTTTTTATTTPSSSSLLSYPEPIFYSPLMSSSELLSSSSYSCNSSPNSIVSPLSGDVFLPMQQVEMMSNSSHFNTYDQQASCMDIYQFDGQNQLDMCIEEEEEERVHEEGEQILIDESNITHHSKNLDTITNIISIDECMDAVNNDTFISNTNSSGILHNWSSNLPFSESMLMSTSTSTSSSSSSLLSSIGSSSSSSSLPLTTTKTMITVNNNDYDDNEHGEHIGASNRHLPLTIDVMKSTNENLITLSSTSSSTITTLNPPPSHHHQHHQHHLHHNISISIDNDLNDTDFSITNDNDNFDSTFDAMMNSIDITTFLPGTFQTNEEQDQSIHNDYDHVQLNSYHHEIYHNDQHEFMKMDEFDESCHIINDVIATTITTTTVATITSSSSGAATATAAASSSFMNKPTNSQLYNVIRSDIDFIHHNHLGNENRAVRIISPLQKIGKQSSLTYSHPISSSSSLQGTQCSTSLSSSSSSSTSSVLRMNSLHELLNNSPQVCSSTLADLDSLDKSSLFIIKPEWSVLA